MEVSEDYGVSLNIFILATRSDHNIDNIYIRDQSIERVKKYNFLGTLFNQNIDNFQEIRVRIEKA